MTVVGPTGREAVGTAARSRAPDEPISARQPAVGLLGLLLVVPIAAALAIGAGGEGSVRVLAPIVTYSLPLVAMVAFWWEDWPGTRFRAS